MELLIGTSDTDGDGIPNMQIIIVAVLVLANSSSKKILTRRCSKTT